MKITKHAEKRSRQRGFSDMYIQLLLLFGEETIKPGNALEYKLPKKFIQELDKIKKKAVLVVGNEIVTVYNLR